MKEQQSNNQIGHWQTVESFEECRRRFNQQSFSLTHRLADHPLFSFDALIEAAKNAAKRPNDLYVNAGDVKVTDSWDSVPMPERPVAEILRRIETAGAWIIVKHVEVDPAYAVILDEFTEFIHKLSGSRDTHPLKNPEMQILITSPNRVTMFHIDYEVNFLVQIRGQKHVWVCDPNDRNVVTDEEIEKFYAGHQSAATYKAGVEDRARHFDLKAGQGVHIPTHAAHWVKNADNISVSLSLNFELPPALHRYIAITNYVLRHAGVKPRPPGQSPVSDHVKRLAGGMAVFGYGLLKRAKKHSR
jgi:Cupin-like domain